MAKFCFQTDSVVLAERITALFREDEERASAPTTHSDRLQSWYRSLTAPGRDFVTEVAYASKLGKRGITRTELREKVKINNVPVGDADDRLKGVIGSVGVAWHKVFPSTANPFTGRFESSVGDQVYQIDDNLAGSVMSLGLHFGITLGVEEGVAR
jgi:hypothetical protein